MACAKQLKEIPTAVLKAERTELYFKRRYLEISAASEALTAAEAALLDSEFTLLLEWT